MAQRLDRLNRSADIAEESNKRPVSPKASGLAQFKFRLLKTASVSLRLDYTSLVEQLGNARLLVVEAGRSTSRAAKHHSAKGVLQMDAPPEPFGDRGQMLANQAQLNELPGQRTHKAKQAGLSETPCRTSRPPSLANRFW